MHSFSRRLERCLRLVLTGLALCVGGAEARATPAAEVAVTVALVLPVVRELHHTKLSAAQVVLATEVHERAPDGGCRETQGVELRTPAPSGRLFIAHRALLL
jgi:hypothetical protein